jgi:branched-chain amino acid aminotransferase
MISNGEIFTPPISEGCIAGIIRGLLMKHLLTQGWKLQERPIAEADLKNADEIFLTNSLRGIMQVACLDDKELKNNLTAAISVSFGEI